MKENTKKNKFNHEDIKEVSLVSHYVFMIPNDYWYKDLLRVSEHWISYKRNSFKTGHVVAEWSYKSKKHNYLWESLTEHVFLIFQSEKPWVLTTDTGSFNLRITFKNDEHWDLSLTSDFANNGLEDLASLFKEMIPSEEIDYPDVLNVIPLFYEEYLLSKENIKDLKKEDICAFMYAEGGAMGSPGEVCILDINGGKYSTEGVYSDDGCDISQIEVLNMYFDGFEHINGFAAPDYMNCSINERGWKYINLGFGNHLYVRNDFWYEHGNRIMNVKASTRYENWKRLIKES